MEITCEESTEMVASDDGGHNESDASECAAVADVLPAVHQRLEAGELFYGHGTDNAWDEAVQLLLACLDLPPTSGDEVLSLLVPASRQARIDDWIGEERPGTATILVSFVDYHRFLPAERKDG
jgi:hypothetical protein